MTEIKGAILILCKHLSVLFDITFKPEFFRLAKYNKSSDNVVEAFWILLSKITQQQSSSKSNVRAVKIFFLTKLKYDCIQFYSLPEDMSHGSRELLIAFSYILALDYLNSFVQDAIVNCPLNPEFKSEQSKHSIGKMSFNLKQFKSDEDFKNAVMWMEGRIDQNKKTSLDYQQQFKKLAHKISLKSFPEIDLSFAEILAVSGNKQHAKEFLDLTEIPSKIAYYHESWLQKQSMYWEWLNSVLLERQKEAPTSNLQEIEKFLIQI